MTNNLQDLRKQIDEADQQWLSALARRFAVTKQVGELKSANNMPLVDPDREARQMAHIAEIAKEHGVNPKLAQDILRLIIDEVVKNHSAIRESQHGK